MFMYINEVMCSSARPTIAKPRPFPDFYPDSAAVFTQTLHRSPSEYFIEIYMLHNMCISVGFFYYFIRFTLLIIIKITLLTYFSY